MSNDKDTAVINLVINGEQAKTSLREMTGALSKVRSELAGIKEEENPARYRELIAQEKALASAQLSRREAIFSTTKALQQQKEEQQGFFANFKKGFEEMSEMAGKITFGSLIYKSVSWAVSAVSDLINGSKEAYLESVKGQAQIDAALKSTQGVAGETKTSLNDLAKSLMDLTGVDDDVIGKSEQMLLTFTNIRGKIYEQAVPAITDMASAMNQGVVNMENIQTTSVLVGKALNDPIKGMTALAKVGVTFNDQQKEQIKTLVESNRLQDAQGVILKELQKEFGGAAKAAADSDDGLQRYETRIGNIKENIGKWEVAGKSLEIAVLNPFLGWLEKITTTKVSDTLLEDQQHFLALRIELESNNTSLERRHTIIEQLKQNYPGYLSQVDSDKVKNKELLPILDQINDAFVLRIAYQQRSEKLDDAVKAQAEATNDVYNNKQKLILQIAKIQQEMGDDGIKFTVRGNTENEKAIYIYKNLLNSIRDQAKGNSDLNQVLASNKYDLLISGLVAYGNDLADANRHLKDTRQETKNITDDLTRFKKDSGYDQTIPGADLLKDLSEKVKSLNAVLATAKKGSAEYKNIVAVINEANAELKAGVNDKNSVGKVSGTMAKIDDLLKPVSGPPKTTVDERKRKLDEYNKQLAELRQQSDQLAESARKGTIDDLDAQIKLIQDKYEKVIGEIKKLLNDPHITAAVRKELNGRINTLTGDEKLDEDNTRDAFNKKQADKAAKDKEAEFKASEGRVNNIYDNGQSDLNNQQNVDLNNVPEGDPAIVEARRFNIQQIYAEKSYELEQAHLNDLKDLYAVYGKDTGTLDKKIADNTIKENDRAAKVRIDQDKKYKDAKKALQDLELDNAEQGAKLLESLFAKNTLAYKAAFLIEQSMAAARVVINTEASIAAFAAANAGIPIVGEALIAAYTTQARISEGISLAAIAVQTVGGLKGKSDTKAKKGALIPQGPSHEQDGINLVNNRTGEAIAEMEGGEPIMILSRETYANNPDLIDQLLFNSMYNNGAKVDVPAVSSSIRQFKSGGIFSTGTDDGNSQNTASWTASATDMNTTNGLLREMIKKLDLYADRPINPAPFNDRAYQEYQARKQARLNRANPK